MGLIFRRTWCTIDTVSVNERNWLRRNAQEVIDFGWVPHLLARHVIQEYVRRTVIRVHRDLVIKQVLRIGDRGARTHN